jgi:probable rRNA maturation factor
MMILLDPDLDSGPRRKADAAKRHAGCESSHKDFGLPVPRLPSARGLSEFLARAQAAVRLRGEVSVLLTTDAAIRRLNRQFRGKNKATDVLSFPAAGVDGDRVAHNHDRKRERLAGDLAISVETARRQSVEQGHALAMEVRILILHGLLHLHGFDHEKDAGEMARRERTLRARLGLAQGLIERAGPPILAGTTRKDGARKPMRATKARSTG